MKSMFKRFKYLPFIVIVVGLIMFLAKFKFDFILPVLQKETDVRNILWNYRQIELIGQKIILLCGVFAVVILFKEARKNVR